MSGHAFSPTFLAAGFSAFVPAITVLVRKWPGIRRPIILVGSLLWIGLGVALTRLPLNFPGGEVTGWITAVLGAFLLFVAGPGWRNFRPLERDETEVALKPSPNRPLRRFSGAP
jgi:hypothetical protein